MRLVTLSIEGTLPLLLHSQRCLNLRDPLATELATLARKRGKSEEDRQRISELEFQLGLYWDEQHSRVYYPSFNIIRSIQDGAKKLKLGTKVIESLRAHPEHIRVPLIYPGRETVSKVQDLMGRPEHWDVRTVGISGRAVERTRPIFSIWSLKPRFSLDDQMSVHELQESGNYAGLYKGLGDFRVGTDKGGMYGTYTVTVSEEKG